MRRFRMLRRGAPASTMCKLLGRYCGTTEEPHRVGVTGHPLKPSGNSLAFRSCPMYQTTAAQHSPYRRALGDITTHTYIRRYRLARSSPVPVRRLISLRRHYVTFRPLCGHRADASRKQATCGSSCSLRAISPQPASTLDDTYRCFSRQEASTTWSRWHARLSRSELLA